MNTLAFATIKELRAKLDSKQISSRETIEFFARRFEAFDSSIGSALEVFDVPSIEQASASTGTLHGIPGLIKDNILQNGRTATCGSRILENYKAVYDATATARLKQCGAPLMGRANMDEFAMGSSTETSAYHKTKNPWDTSRVPGGSSGGSAAAVAAGFVPWSLGSETGGSVRQPAAFCGITGLKPTYGLISRYGLVAYASSLDQIGIFTHTAYDNAMILSCIAGQDANDSSTLAVQPKDYTATLTGSLRSNLRIGVVENAIGAQGMDSEVVAAIETAIAEFEKLGAHINRIQLPTLDYSAAAYFILSRAEAASNLSRFDGVRYGLRDKKAHSLDAMYANTRHDGFGTEVKSRILIGNYVLSSGHADQYYRKAELVQRAIRRDFNQAFKNLDLLIMPTHPAPAFKFGAFDVDKLQMDLQDYFTCAMNLAGIPALSIPCGFTKAGLPIGFQLAGPHLSEELLFSTAHAYQEVTDWHTKHPDIG